MPAECMQLSELDGFLAGIAVGPWLIMPSVWLPLVWRDDAPFDDLRQANEILGIMMRCYNEILRLADTGPGAYQPVFAVDEAGAACPGRSVSSRPSTSARTIGSRWWLTRSPDRSLNRSC
jgi:yecA family protein